MLQLRMGAALFKSTNPFATIFMRRSSRFVFAILAESGHQHVCHAIGSHDLQFLPLSGNHVLVEHRRRQQG